MTKCDECKKQISRSGRGHTAECETGIKTAQALEEVKERAREQHENSKMPRPEFKMPKGE
jgi:hypothetical protein